MLIKSLKSQKLYKKKKKKKNSETVTNEHDKKYLRKDISPEGRKKIIDDLRLI